jgi:hypothetical protein
MTIGQTEAIGVTGHQNLPASAIGAIREMLHAWLARFDNLQGVTSLAAGADQLFAQEVLNAGGELYAIVPSANYDRSFENSDDRETFHKLLAKSAKQLELAYSEPSEEAFWAAGREVVKRSHSLVAVWDGRPAAGLGGTADVVGYAKQSGKKVHVIWPEGAKR